MIRPPCVPSSRKASRSDGSMIWQNASALREALPPSSGSIPERSPVAAGKAGSLPRNQALSTIWRCFTSTSLMSLVIPRRCGTGLTRPNRISEMSPLALLDTAAGLKEVDQLLGRIEHGDFVRNEQAGIADLNAWKRILSSAGVSPGANTRKRLRPSAAKGPRIPGVRTKPGYRSSIPVPRSPYAPWKSSSIPGAAKH